MGLVMSDLKYQRIVRAVAETPWAILPSKLSVILDVLAFRAAGGALTDVEIAERIGAARDRPKLRSNGDIAVLQLVGTIAHRMGSMAASSGGTSVEAFRNDFRAAVDDSTIAAIVIDVDSPGGSVDGVPELAAEIYRARGVKPISAVANTMAASAAYWIGSAADELAVTPSGEVGSIGVIAAHEDMSAAYETMGVKTTLVSAGKYKAENNPFEPLSDEGRAAIQQRVDDAYTMFTKDVSRNRNTPLDTVRSSFGEGRLVNAKEAVRLGMADRVATLDDVIATVGRRRVSQPTNANAIAGLSLREQAESALGAVQSLDERVAALGAVRLAEAKPRLGRDNADWILDMVESLDAVNGQFRALYAAITEPERAAADVQRAMLDFLLLEARMNGVPVA